VNNSRNIDYLSFPNLDVAKERALYGQADRHSSIANCDTITGDNRWAGEIFSNESQFITTSLTGGAGNNCTYEQEDTAVAGALSRFPELSGNQFDPSRGNYLLNCYLNLRAPSAFNQPYPGQPLQAFIDAGVRANTMATNNLHLVGFTMVKQLLKDGLCNL
jgi:purine nucleoside permease